MSAEILSRTRLANGFQNLQTSREWIQTPKSVSWVLTLSPICLTANSDSCWHPKFPNAEKLKQEIWLKVSRSEFMYANMHTKILHRENIIWISAIIVIIILYYLYNKYIINKEKLHSKIVQCVQVIEQLCKAPKLCRAFSDTRCCRCILWKTQQI